MSACAVCRVWDLSTQKCTAVLKGHTDWINSVALSGSTCVSGSDDMTVRCAELIHSKMWNHEHLEAWHGFGTPH